MGKHEAGKFVLTPVLSIEILSGSNHVPNRLLTFRGKRKEGGCQENVLM